MAQQKAIITTLKSPVQEDGSRVDIFPRTIADAIVVTDKNGNQKQLDDYLHEKVESKTNDGDAKIDDIPFISATTPDHACLWAKIDPEKTSVDQ